MDVLYKNPDQFGDGSGSQAIVFDKYCSTRGGGGGLRVEAQKEEEGRPRSVSQSKNFGLTVFTSRNLTSVKRKQKQILTS